MTMLEWLTAVNASKEHVGPDHTVREFVTGLHERDSLYHFDDNPTDIDNGKTGNPLFTPEEAALCREIVAFCYCEAMFTLAMQLMEDTGCSYTK